MIVRNGIKWYSYADMSAIFSITQNMIIYLFRKLQLMHTRTIINRKCYISQETMVEFTKRYYTYLANAKMGRKKKER